MAEQQLIPTRFLFRFEIPIRRLNRAPTIDGNMADWPDACRLPPLHAIDGQDGFADVRMGWRDDGLYLACRVTGKRRPPRCDPAKFWRSDNVRLMTDMRDARENRRATRFCQQFYFLPTGGGRGGRSAVAGAHRIQRAHADAPLASSDRLRVASMLSDDGYALEAHVPAAALAGFDPVNHPRIGVYVMVEDAELGQQYLTVGDDLSWYYDPSTWATGVLAE